MKILPSNTFYSFNQLLLIVWCLLPIQSLSANSIDSIKQSIKHRVANEDVMSLLGYAAGYAHNDLPLALALSELAKDKALQMNDQEKLFNVYREQGYYFEDNNKMIKAKEAYKSALECSNKLENNSLRQTIYTDLAIVNRKTGNYKIAKDYHLLSLALAEEDDDQEMIEYAYHGLGFLYETVGDYDKAIDYYLKSVAIAEARGYISGTITTLQNIGLTYIKLGNKELALESIEKAYMLATDLKDTIQTANVLNDHGEILVTSGEYESALQKFRASLGVYEMVNYKPTIARSLINIAEVYVKQDKYDLAQHYFLRSLRYKKYIRTEDFANLYNKLGILYLKQEASDKAEKAFQQSLTISIENDYKKISQSNHQHLYEIYKDISQFQEALIHLESSKSLKDSLLSIDKARQIAEMQFKFDMAQGEKEIHALRLKQNRFFLLGSFILFTFLISVLAYILKLRVKNNHSLKIKNAEIEAQNIKLRESNEVHKQFAYVAAHDLKEPLRNIGSFINLLERRFGHQFNEEAREYMNFVTGGVRRLNSLLADLLSYSQVSGQEAQKDLVNLTTILQEVEFNLKDVISHKKAEIQYPNHFPQIKMGKDHLLQLIQHIISNALKFVHDKDPIIEIKYTVQSDQLLLSIKDNGIGINEEYGHKIFNLFHRLNRNNNDEGTGIGLSICKNIIDKYDAQIWFESEMGKGTTFFLLLPTEISHPNSITSTTNLEVFSTP